MLCGLTLGIFRLCGERTHMRAYAYACVRAPCGGGAEFNWFAFETSFRHSLCVWLWTRCWLLVSLLVKEARLDFRKDWTRKAVTGLLLSRNHVVHVLQGNASLPSFKKVTEILPLNVDIVT